MKHDAIWLVAGGPMQVGAAKRIKALGYKLILTDGNPGAICRPLADAFVTVDTFATDEHLRLADAFSKEYNIRAVLTISADCHPTVAALGERLGLPHVPPAISHVCRVKSKTRELLKAHGLPQPWSVSVTSHQEACEVLRDRPQDVVMKATDNSGSRGLQVLSKGQLPSAEEFAYTQSNGSTGEVILEERLEADPTQVSECSVETLWLDGKMHWFNWVDRIFGRDLHLFPSLKGRYQVRDGIEVGHINPAHHAPAVKDAVFDAMEKAGQALGFHELRGGHLLKGDIFITKAGPVILELTPRCSGGWDSSATSPARGADLHGGLIQLALGAPLTLDLWHRHFNFRHGEQSAVILATVPDGAVDCIGRQYAMATGCEPLETLLNSAQHKLDKGDYLVPIL